MDDDYPSAISALLTSASSLALRGTEEARCAPKTEEEPGPGRPHYSLTQYTRNESKLSHENNSAHCKSFHSDRSYGPLRNNCLWQKLLRLSPVRCPIATDKHYRNRVSRLPRVSMVIARDPNRDRAESPGPERAKQRRRTGRRHREEIVHGKEQRHARSASSGVDGETNRAKGTRERQPPPPSLREHPHRFPTR